MHSCEREHALQRRRPTGLRGLRSPSRQAFRARSRSRRYIVEGDASTEETGDGLLVGGVEHRRSRTARATRLHSQSKRGKLVVSDRLEGHGEHATGSNDRTPSSMTRSGCVSAYRTGSSIVGTLICASTLPSTNSTIECTTICGCTTTSMRSYGSPNRKVRLDHLERLVRQRRAVDGDLAAHAPRRMPQRVLDRRARETAQRASPETARPTR